MTGLRVVLIFHLMEFLGSWYAHWYVIAGDLEEVFGVCGD